MEGLNYKPRKLSRFLAQQLLYAFFQGRLDSRRRQAMESALLEFPELRKELESYKLAKVYCEKLSEVEVPAAVVEGVIRSEPLWPRFLGLIRWQRWPDILKWSTEAFLLSAVALMFALVFPWQNLVQKWQEMDLSPPKVTQVQSEAEPDVEKIIASTEEEEEPSAAEVEAVSPKISSPIVEDSQQEISASATQKGTDSQEVNQAAGTLYRMMMKMEGIGQKSEEVANLIRSFGGQRAGQVQLGWRKPNGNYYHFSLPETHKQDLLEKLNTYAPVRSYKHAHSRVMPEGQMRIILFIEEDKPKTKKTTDETPEAKIKPEIQQPQEVPNS